MAQTMRPLKTNGYGRCSMFNQCESHAKTYICHTGKLLSYRLFPGSDEEKNTLGYGISANRNKECGELSPHWDGPFKFTIKIMLPYLLSKTCKMYSFERSSNLIYREAALRKLPFVRL